ncbi:hypothetical protein Q5P01_006889 [Channa striata]|uniref:Uncharacterized protein n=1 Tax=Channa striata TaxID=64152 RepID=A0AA88NIM6_CHASR|nr:hypothetical protein Q5P01_006889 [Channa striata]
MNLGLSLEAIFLFYTIAGIVIFIIMSSLAGAALRSTKSQRSHNCTMSVEFYSASGPAGNDASHQSTTLGGSKPLHRFMKGQPKLVGIIMLAFGVSFLIVPLSVNNNSGVHRILTSISPVLLMGTLFLISGILYILTEHNPTKKTVTVSLALSIVTILFAVWSVLQMISGIRFHHYGHYDYSDDNATETDDTEWSTYSENMGLCLDALFLFYTLASIVIYIIMSSLAGAALRSTKSQAVVVMTTMPTQAAAE